MNKQLKLRAAAQAGFTLIELIIVIVIIGILAAVAIPKYQDLTTDAKNGVASGVAAAAASASSTNYARKQGGTGGIAVTSCAGLASLIDVPSGYGFSGTLTAGSSGTCSVTGNGTATFTAWGA